MQRGFGDVFVLHFGASHDVVDNLVFKQRGAQLLLHLLVFLHELKVSALLARILTCRIQNGLGHFLFRDRHFSLTAHFGQQKAQAHAAFGQNLMLFSRLDRPMVVAVVLRVFFVPQLVGDLAGFCIHQAGGQVKLHQSVQLVQQRPLHHSARCRAILHLQPLADLAAQSGHVFGAVFLGQLVVQLGRNGLLHGFHRAFKHRRFASQIGRTISFGEGHIHAHSIACRSADQLRLETRDERVRAQNQRIIFASTAIKGHAIDRALEVDRHLIAVFGLGAFFAVFKALRRRGQVCQSLLHRSVIGLDRQPVQLDLGCIDIWNRRQGFVGHLDHNVLTFFPSVTAHHFHIGLHRRTIA